MAPKGGLRCQSGKWQAACLEVPAGGLAAQGGAASRPDSLPGPSTWSQRGCPRSPRPGVTSRIQPCSQNVASSAEPCWARAFWGPGATGKNWTALEAVNSQPYALQGAATGPPDKCGSLSHQMLLTVFWILPSTSYYLLLAPCQLTRLCQLALCCLCPAQSFCWRLGSSTCMRRGGAEIHQTTGSMPKRVASTAFCASTCY